MSDDEIRVNGAFEALEPTITALLAAKGLNETRGLAVALNETLVPKSAWGVTALAVGDMVEIVRAVGGG
jgi:sulfur carrier protein